MMRAICALGLVGVFACAGGGEPLEGQGELRAAVGGVDLSDALPIVFVHGGAGSGAQYASIAK